MNKIQIFFSKAILSILKEELDLHKQAMPPCGRPAAVAMAFSE